MVSERTAKRIAAKRKQLRRNLWPKLDESRLWNRTEAKGFITIPRTMPIISKIINEISQQGPLSSTYLELWCRSHDEAIVEINAPQEHAFFAGFTGQRGVQTWTTRMRELERLGFISTQSGATGEFNYVLIWNPHTVILEMAAKGEQTFKKDSLVALKARLTKIGAKDVDAELF